MHLSLSGDFPQNGWVKLLQTIGSQKVFLSRGIDRRKSAIANQWLTGTRKETLSCGLSLQGKPFGS